MEQAYKQIQAEILKGTLQERLGYDLHQNVLNRSWENLPEKYKEKFQDFLEKEGEMIAFNKKSDIVIEREPVMCAREGCESEAYLGKLCHNHFFGK